MRHAAAGRPITQEHDIRSPRHAGSLAGRIVALSALGALGTLALISVAAAAVTVKVARTVVTPPRRRDEDIRVLAVADDTVTLSATKDSLLPGRYGLWFDRGSGHARLGDIVATGTGTVTRRLAGVDFGELRAGARARLNGWYYLSPRELGYDYENVVVETELGAAPAWLIPAAAPSTAAPSTSWVIEVHGRAVRRSETLRAVPVFHEAGYSALLVSYRNDEDAPGSDDRRYALGDVEWRDVDAAIGFAIERGATDIVLMGWSMGGAIVLQTATRSQHAELIRGIVLDSPVIDWASVLGFQGAQLRMPVVASRAVLAVIGSTWGRRLTGQAEAIDLARLDFVARAGELSWPVLLMHSDDDGYVPSNSSHALAEARPDIVTFDAYTVARHTKLWNYDSARWNLSIAAFLATLAPRPSARTDRSSRPPEAG
jgi:alpha-beta hydrolase superfamily lysophospholipase